MNEHLLSAPSTATPISSAAFANYYQLITRIARGYHIPASSCLEPADLIQEGYLGLLEAQKRFDSSKHDSHRSQSVSLEQAFETYAAKWIHKFITDALHRYRSAVSYPPSHPFSDEDATISFDTVIHHGQDGSEDITLADTIPDADTPNPEQRITYAETLHILERNISALPPRHQLIFRRLFHDGASATEIAAELGISPVRVRVIKHDILRKLNRNI